MAASNRCLNETYDYTLSNEEKIRALIVEELLDSEKAYIEKLEFMIRAMKQDLHNCSELITYGIHDGHVTALFGNIEEIYRLHKEFFAKLREAVPEGQDRDLENRIGYCFVEMKEDFVVYDDYVSNQATSQTVMSELVKMKSWKQISRKWIKEIRESHVSDTDLKATTVLQTYLQEPLRRIVTYSVLLKVLATFTALYHRDMSDLTFAHQIVHSLLAPFDPKNQFDLLKAAFDHCDECNRKLAKSGLLGKHGFMTKQGGNIKNWKIRWFVLQGNKLKYYHEPAEDLPLYELDLKQCSTVVEESSLGKYYCFSLHMPDRIYNMYCISDAEKLAWMNAIAWRIFNFKSSSTRADLCMMPYLLFSTGISPILDLVQKHNSALSNAPITTATDDVILKENLVDCHKPDTS